MRMYDGYAMNIDKLKVRYPEGLMLIKQITGKTEMYRRRICNIF